MKSKQKEERRNIIQKLERQYQNLEKPLIYEYKNPGTTVPQRKFGILVTWIKDTLENGMRPEYVEEDEDETVKYWSELTKQYQGTYEMDFVSDELYCKNKQKLKEYIVILMSAKKLFEVIEDIDTNMSYMYANRNVEQHNSDLEAIRFLREGSYEINCDIVTQFNAYCEERHEREVIEERRKEKERFEMERRQRERREEEMKIKRQQEERERALAESRRLEQERMQKARLEREAEPQLTRPVAESWMPQNIVLDFSRPSVAPTPFSNHMTETPNSAHMKNSERLFQMNFKEMQSQYAFAERPVESTDKTQCFQCKKPLSAGLYIIGHNQNYCYYTGQWYCNDCISPERRPICWKAKQQFDLRGYSVCKKALIQINSLYERPIIQINNEANIVKNNNKLFNFLILKREVHLMYDSICNTQFIERLLSQRINYCLKLNLFSLKNLYDIYNSQEEVYLSKMIDSLSSHFYQCRDCQKKGYKCKICRNPVRIFPFELKTTKGCLNCKKLYHRECIQVKGCICSHH